MGWCFGFFLSSRLFHCIWYVHKKKTMLRINWMEVIEMKTQRVNWIRFFFSCSNSKNKMQNHKTHTLFLPPFCVCISFFFLLWLLRLILIIFMYKWLWFDTQAVFFSIWQFARDDNEMETKKNPKHNKKATENVNVRTEKKNEPLFEYWWNDFRSTQKKERKKNSSLTHREENAALKSL